MTVELRRHLWVPVLWLAALGWGLATGNGRLVGCCLATVAIAAAAIALLTRLGDTRRRPPSGGPR